MKFTLIVVCISIAYGRYTNKLQSDKLSVAWAEHERPVYNIEGAHVQAPKPENDKHQRHTTELTNARDFLKKHPDVVSEINKMLDEIPDRSEVAYDTQNTTTFICPEYGQFICDITPTAASEYEAVASVSDKWRQLVSILVDDTEDCIACVDFVTQLKDLICSQNIPWPVVRDFFIDVCLLTNIMAPDICVKYVTIQGEQKYCVIRQADPRNLCESMNDCYPPDDRVDRPPVSERTPWAVKAKLESDGKWPSHKHQLEGHTSRMTPEGDKYIKVAALADIHLQMRHAVGSAVSYCHAYVCCLEELDGQGSARYWGEYTCNLPMHTLQLFLDRVSGMQPDFVVYAGDSPPHTMWDETEASQMNCSQIVVDAMTKSFGTNLRIYPAIGNHEMYPTNVFSMRMGETQRMLQRFTEIWSKPAGFNSENNSSFANMTSYSLPVPSHSGLRIVTINTELDWYATNIYATLNEHTPENDQHKRWVNDTLRQARENNETVIIISHHPVGGSYSHVRSARWWEQIAIEYSDVIVLHVSGHTHHDELKLSFDPMTMDAVAVNHIAPSTTSKTYINPSLIVYYLDPTTLTLVDYESFHLEIKDQEQSIGVPPAIVFGYSAREEYGLIDLSPEAYRDLIIRFTEDDALFQKYSQNRNSHSSPESYCDHECKITEICNMWFPEVNEANECISLAPPEVIITTTSEGIVDGAENVLHSAVLILILTLSHLLLHNN